MSQNGPLQSNTDRYNKVLIAAGIIVSCVLIYLLRYALLPFFLAAMLAYFSNPLVKKFMRMGLSRIVAVSIVFSILFISITLLILLVIPLIQKQSSNLSTLLPDFIASVKTKVNPYLTRYFDINLQDSTDADSLKAMVSQHFFSGNAVQAILNSSKVLVEGLINLILIPVVTFYFLRDWDGIIDKLYDFIPTRKKPQVKKLARECDSVLGSFFRGQLLVMLFLSIFYSITLTLLGLKIGVVIGIIVGLISIVPYLGVIIGIVIASVAALVQFGTVSSMLWVWLVFAIGHSIENFYLTPKLIGDRIGLHPVLVIFSILAGGTLFGFLGVLLAMPVAALALVFYRHFRQHLAISKPA